MCQGPKNAEYIEWGLGTKIEIMYNCSYSFRNRPALRWQVTASVLPTFSLLLEFQLDRVQVNRRVEVSWLQRIVLPVFVVVVVAAAAARASQKYIE